MKTLFVTFGGGEKRYRAAARRIARQASDTGLFCDTWAVTDLDMYNFAPRLGEHRPFIERSPHGYGYWLWKPYLLDAACNAGFDHVVYADAGCVLNLSSRTPRSRLQDYLELATEHGITLMALQHPERQYTKRDTWECIGLTDEQLDQPQCVGGVLTLRADRAPDLLREWIRWCTTDNYHLLDDSPSASPELPEFVAHRHDQTILSCIAKRSELPVIADETYFDGAWDTDGATKPIWAVRHRWGTSWPIRGAARRLRYRREVKEWKRSKTAS
ncbi:unannotated protein [freshwater metagenome]|uniref:Unannotated protein n=1 Tax=freshwater metagenome TaxID=449393 RepID=A0A6J7NPG3_9ZZZZ|nr:hypothetical protein [Actinomycetota bacterium]MSY71187.1 hypothetical protein [Actinomycetota bacterium]